MATFKFCIEVIERGVIEVEADNLEEARDLAYCMDGDYFCHKSDVVNLELVK